jgi:DNA primase
MKTVSTTPLKERVSFRQLLIADGHQVKKVGKSYKLSCPFHLDNTPSFVIFDDDTGGKCFGCNWTGDIINYLMKARKQTFRQACDTLKKLPSRTSQSQPSSSVNTVKEVKKLNETGRRIIATLCQFLASSKECCNRVAKERNWKPETIRSLAEDGSLGCSCQRLAFMYPEGLKLRKWPEKKVWWELGGIGVWRAHSITEKTKRVFLCEGETDAITLIDKGLSRNPETAIIAIPSATTHPPELPTLLQGKEVILCMDADEAGKRAEQKLIELLRPVCASLKTINPAKL